MSDEPEEFVEYDESTEDGSWDFEEEDGDNPEDDETDDPDERDMWPCRPDDWDNYGSGLAGLNG